MDSTPQNADLQNEDACPEPVNNSLIDTGQSQSIGINTVEALPTNSKWAELVNYHKLHFAKSISWTLAGATFINWSIQLLSGTTVYPAIALLVILTGIWGLAVIASCWLRPFFEIKSKYIRIFLFSSTVAFFVVCFATWFFIQLRMSPGYGTDEIAFNQYAASLVSHGINPYTHSMLPSFDLYKVSPDGFTYHLNGTPVTALSYPALSFLIYEPFLAFGWSTQMAIVVNVIFWILTCICLIVILPSDYKGLAIVLGSISSYASYAIGGVTDVVYLPFLMLSAYTWPLFVYGKGWKQYISPVLFGIAISIKQTPWIDAPFFLACIILETQLTQSWKTAIKRGGLFTGITSLVFLIPNIPYLLLNTKAWFKGILTPFAKGIVPAGQGVVGFSIFLHLGGGSLSAYSLLSIAVFILLLVLYIFTYPLMRPITFFLASLILFFATRSFGSYLICLIPVLIVAALGSERARLATKNTEIHYLYKRLLWLKQRIHKSAFFGICAVLFLLVIYHTLSSSPPLSLKITSLRSTGQLATVQQLSVLTTNETGGTVTPYFTVNEGGAITTFWQIAKGPSMLKPHQSATYLIEAPNLSSQPSIAGGFQVDAFTTTPGTVSASSPYSPDSEHLFLTPEAVNQTVAINHKIVIHAALLNQINQPIREAGVPVYMGQIIYDQLGLLYSEAVINHGQPGQTPVTAYTNSQGIATFTIYGTQVTQDPVYFEANLVSPTGFYPYGYSQILSIRFKYPNKKG